MILSLKSISEINTESRSIFRGQYSVESKEDCSSETPSEISCKCQVIDISRNGIGILFTDNRQVAVGDILQVEFKLDDPLATKISQKCEVRHIKDTYAGCKILNDAQALGMYLLEQSKP